MKSTKALFFFIIAILLVVVASAQVTQMGGPDNTFPGRVNVGSGKLTQTDPSAYLEVGKPTGSNKGILFPRGIKEDIPSPAKGLIIFDIPSAKLWIYNGSSWELVGYNTFIAGTPSDTLFYATRYWVQQGKDSLNSLINLRVKYTDTASMLFPYVRKPLAMKYSDTASMLIPYFKVGDTITLSARIDDRLKTSDTAAMLAPVARKADSLSFQFPLFKITNKVYLNITDAWANAQKIQGKTFNPRQPLRHQIPIFNDSLDQWMPGYLDSSGNIFVEQDSIALSKPITHNQGYGITITGTPSQALSTPPVWSYKLDTAGLRPWIGQVAKDSAVSTEVDPIANAKTVAVVAGYGITIPEPTQTLSTNPYFTAIADTASLRSWVGQVAKDSVITGIDSAAYHTSTQLTDTSFTLNRLDGTKDTIRITGVTGGGGGGVTTINNLGAGYRWWDPVTPGLKTFFNGYGLILDSTSNTNGITATVDTSATGLATYNYVTNNYTTLNLGKQTKLTLTTTGKSGASGLDGSGNLNIPNYSNTNLGSGYKLLDSLAQGIKSLKPGLYIGLDSTTTGEVKINADTTTMGPWVRTQVGSGGSSGGVSTSTTITINGVTQDLSTNRTWTVAVGGTVTSITSSTTAGAGIDPNVYGQLNVTALSTSATINNPTGGTAVDGARFIYRIKDNGTARALSFVAALRFSADLPAPTTTTVNKTMYIGIIYNAADSKWDVVSIVNNF
jgi:hypothetical protein